MAGKARGGKQTSSFTHEQLQALGYVGKDIPPVPTAPPPAFPPLPKKLIPPEISPIQNFKILWKEEFLNYMRDSPYYLTPKIQNANVEKYSDQLIDALENTKEKCKAEIPWDLMPEELRPNAKRKKTTTAGTAKRPKEVDIESKLKILEEKEKSGPPNEKAASDSEKEDDENQEEIEEDDEMDEENDYGNNYFDNGEAYNDEDDNLDDGPTY